jgi:hypothetical protein
MATFYGCHTALDTCFLMYKYLEKRYLSEAFSFHIYDNYSLMIIIIAFLLEALDYDSFQCFSEMFL